MAVRYVMTCLELNQTVRIESIITMYGTEDILTTDDLFDFFNKDGQE